LIVWKCYLILEAGLLVNIYAKDIARPALTVLDVANRFVYETGDSKTPLAPALVNLSRTVGERSVRRNVHLIERRRF